MKFPDKQWLLVIFGGVDWKQLGMRWCCKVTYLVFLHEFEQTQGDMKDREAWQAAVHGVAKSWALLSISFFIARRGSTPQGLSPSGFGLLVTLPQLQFMRDHKAGQKQVGAISDCRPRKQQIERQEMISPFSAQVASLPTTEVPGRL